MQGKKLIFYELNEVPLRIFDHFAKLMPNSALGKLARHARRYETYAEDSGHLSPWVTWPTLHRGVTNLSHEISHFGQDLGPANKEFPPIWSLLARAGVRTGMFGSLQSYPLPDDLDNYAFYVPDTFAAGPECFPKRLEAFQRFNLAMVDRSARAVDSGIALPEAMKFLRAAPGLGLRGSTTAKLVSQLASEQVKPERIVRRRTSQVQIAFDFFLAGLKRERPDAAFFFTNHVASSMHRYWPALFPDDYKVFRFDQDWLAQWGGEIPFAMREAAAQLHDLIRFVDSTPGYALVVAGSMGQEALQRRKRVDRELNLIDYGAFARAMGLQPGEWSKERAMAPRYMYAIPERAAMDRFIQAASSLRINGGHPEVLRIGEDRACVALGFQNLPDDAIEIELMGAPVDPAALGLKNMSLQDAAGANAYHIPEGMCLIYEPGTAPHAPETRKVSTIEFAPSILANFGVEAPAYMEPPLAL